MAKTIPASITLLDPFREIVPRRECIARQLQHLIEGQNYLYSKFRRVIISDCFVRNNVLQKDEGVLQGSGADASMTGADATNTKTHRLTYFYKTRAVPDNLEIVRLAVLAETGTLTGTVTVDFYARDGSGAVLNTIARTVTVAAPTWQTTDIAASTLDANTTYLVKVSLTTGNNAAAWISLYALAMWEEPVALADMPTGP